MALDYQRDHPDTLVSVAVVPVRGGGPTSYNASGTNDHTDLFRPLSGEGDDRQDRRGGR